jgi:stage V sporulation protein B
MKNKFIKSTLILVIGGLITKLLSFIIRIYFTRVIGNAGINIYSIIMPTYSLLVTVTQLGFPVAISSLVARQVKRGKNIVFSVIPISIILNIILIFTVLITGKYLAFNLLHNKDAYYPLISIAFVLPFISLSSIIRGYFFGKQQMMPHSISNIIEQLFKLFIVLLILPKLLKYGTIVAVSGYILISILSEIMSIIIFLLYLPKGFKINKEDLVPDLGTIKDVLSIGLPSVGSRIIGNIGYFLEPIILTNVLLLVGYTEKYIINEYAIYNTYVISVLVVPSFLLMALSISLIPEISKNKGNKQKLKRIYHKVMLFSFLLGLISNLVIYIFAKDILMIVFHTGLGLKYIKFLAFFFVLFYFEGPLASILQALDEAKYSMKTTTIGIIIKLVVMTLLCFTHIGIYSLIISEIVNIIIVNYLNNKKVLKLLK